MNIKKALEETKKLNTRERALLAHCLISSLETCQDENVDEAWFQIAKKCMNELSSGEVEAMSREEVKKEIKGFV